MASEAKKPGTQEVVVKSFVEKLLDVYKGGLGETMPDNIKKAIGVYSSTPEARISGIGLLVDTPSWGRGKCGTLELTFYACRELARYFNFEGVCKVIDVTITYDHKAEAAHPITAPMAAKRKVLDHLLAKGRELLETYVDPDLQIKDVSASLDGLLKVKDFDDLFLYGASQSWALGFTLDIVTPVVFPMIKQRYYHSEDPEIMDGFRCWMLVHNKWVKDETCFFYSRSAKHVRD